MLFLYTISVQFNTFSREFIQLFQIVRRVSFRNVLKIIKWDIFFDFNKFAQFYSFTSQPNFVYFVKQFWRRHLAGRTERYSSLESGQMKFIYLGFGFCRLLPFKWNCLINDLYSYFSIFWKQTCFNTTSKFWPHIIRGYIIKKIPCVILPYEK